MRKSKAEPASRETVPEEDRHLLVAVESSKSSEKAVLYVADFLGGLPGFRVTLLHVIDLANDESLPGSMERLAAVKEQEERARFFLGRYRDILVQAGFHEEKVETLLLESDGNIVSEAILKKHADVGACTIVVGRRGKSRREEFLFGSVSSAIVRQAEKCSVWVIE